MLSSISPVGEATRGQRWWLTAAAHGLASAAGGATAGAAAGGAGWVAGLVVDLSVPARLWLLAAAALLGAAVDRGWIPVGLPTTHRQVDERWLDRYRGWVYGAGYGFQLGLGVVTVVPGSVTYVMLTAAAATAAPDRGALIGLVFGAVRALPLLASRPVRTPAALRRLHRRLADARPAAAALTPGLQAAAGLGALALVLA